MTAFADGMASGAGRQTSSASRAGQQTSRAGLQAVLFDMDGVLVDSEPLWFRVEREVMLQLDGSWSSQDQAACLGGTLEHTAGHMLRRSGSRLSPLEVQRQSWTGWSECCESACRCAPEPASC